MNEDRALVLTCVRNVFSWLVFDSTVLPSDDDDEQAATDWDTWIRQQCHNRVVNVVPKPAQPTARRRAEYTARVAQLEALVIEEVTDEIIRQMGIIGRTMVHEYNT